MSCLRLPRSLLIVLFFQLLDKVLHNALKPVIPPRQQHDIVCLYRRTTSMGRECFQIRRSVPCTET
jgi:hypothetical protein